MKQFLFAILLISMNWAEKSSKDIQQDIDSQNSQLNSLRKEIETVEKNIIKKTKEAISTTEILLDLENKIGLTEKLIRSLSREERHMAALIQETEQRIHNKEAYLSGIREKLTLRLQHIYKHGRTTFLQTVLMSRNWNDAIYRVKYLDILSKHELELRKELQNAVAELEKENKSLKQVLRRKKNLRSEKEVEGTRLEKDKKKRRNYLNEVNKEKVNLESQLKKKQQMMAEIEALIKKLYSDKDAMKRREEELARIRAMQNRATSGNFAKMKGKLPWPVMGKVVSKFGTHKNKKLNTITENVGIDIKTNAGTSVVSVLDGVVSTITYIRGHGNIIIIDHGGGFNTVYAHIERINVNENDYIQAGNTIAKVSDSNSAGGDILHFEVWGNQQKLNPEHWLKKQ